MHYQDTSLILAPTDLSNYLACHHLSKQDLRAAKGQAERPARYSPVIEALRERGLAHEAKYLEHLKAKGLSVVDAQEKNALELMQAGVDVLYQAQLGDETWAGFADFLIKVDTPSELGAWSYEVIDTKLAKETKGGTVLQLLVYSFLLSELQGKTPENLYVVVPGNDFQPFRYRVADYSAYFRLMESGISAFLDSTKETYPEKVAHCDYCVWWGECESRRRSDDHLCYVAGITTSQIRELNHLGVSKLADLANLGDIPKPNRGSLEALERVRDQARIQLKGREQDKPVRELKLPFDEEHGLALLPEPTADDIFLDFEGDHFAEEDSVQEYLTGYVTRGADGEDIYTSIWAQTLDEEQRMFEQFMDVAIETRKRNPNSHIYHFAPYEPAALKRMMGRYASRSVELDELLRGRAFVDLHTVVKRALFASLESYSIKNLEKFFGFTREQEDLRQASISRRIVELAIETGGLTEDVEDHRLIVEIYNRDDCVSTRRLQEWLEQLRAEAISDGHHLPRPALKDSQASEDISELDQRLHALKEALLEEVPSDAKERSSEEQARFILAHILEFHRREDKATWWEYFRVLGLEVEEFEDERKAITGLEFQEVIEPKKAPLQRYKFPPQELDARRLDNVYDPTGEKVGSVTTVNYSDSTIDVKKMVATKDNHPDNVVLHGVVPTKPLQLSLIRLAESILDRGFGYQSPNTTAIRLLLIEPPRNSTGLALLEIKDETTLKAACRLVTELDGSVLAIQGPPGAGKTFSGAEMICACKQAGLKVGVSAVSHDVIVNLLESTLEQAERNGTELSVVHREKGQYEGDWGINRKYNYDHILLGLEEGSIDVVGATAWCWARTDFAESVDVLFIDEAGQMALGNVLAAAQGGKNLILLGDPQQLEQPTQSSHPEGSDVSALEYFLSGEQTMPKDRGLFLGETWRLHPDITRFTSDVYYEGRLTSVAGLEQQKVIGSENYSGSGLRYLPVEHAGNTSKSLDEVDAVAQIVEELLSGHVSWQDKEGVETTLEAKDLLILAPYNAQVAILCERLPELKDRIGTVNKFQGKGAPVVIYSMTSSSPEDAPRGMEFLYDPHRLNVASSRAKAMCILVGSPALFEPDCKTPRQMKMANGLCRYLELVT